jgi:hypothetical protein
VRERERERERERGGERKRESDREERRGERIKYLLRPSAPRHAAHSTAIRLVSYIKNERQSHRRVQTAKEVLEEACRFSHWK